MTETIQEKKKIKVTEFYYCKQKQMKKKHTTCIVHRERYTYINKIHRVQVSVKLVLFQL